jgi:hypothetical protein
VSRERLGNVLPQTNHEPVSSGTVSTPAASVGRPSRSVVVVPIVAGAATITVATANPEGNAEQQPNGAEDADIEVVEFVRFCYRRRSVAWPELYDEMCAVARRGDYRGMTYEQLERLGIGFALSALPRLAAMANRVIAEERGPQPIAAVV